MSISISIQHTENPKVIKFVANKTLLEGSLELDRNSEVAHIPLAKELFVFPFITRLFITANFIAVAKENVVEWELVEQNLSNIITESLTTYPEIILSKKNKVFFYAEKTPNPAVIKFVSDLTLIQGFLELKSIKDTDNVPLAKKLFENFPFINEIFINDNFISIQKSDATEWETVTEKIQTTLADFIQSGQKISLINGNQDEKQAAAINNRSFTETEEKINAIIQEYVAPAVENDGGKISLIEFEEGSKTAKMLLQGACSGCPSSTITLKNGIENLLKGLLPDVVKHVEAING